MNKTSTGYNAVIETVENNYFLELKKIGIKKYNFTVYSEGDSILDIKYKFKRLKKGDFTQCVLDFLNTFKIKNYSFMDF